MPTRVQRRRVKGWKWPDNTTYVGRPTIWGNPFVGAETIKAYRLWISEQLWMVQCDAKHECDCGDFDCDNVMVFDLNRNRLNVSVETNGDNLDAKRLRVVQELPNLAGRNLMCWCALDKPCHGDVLLELANEQIYWRHVSDIEPWFKWNGKEVVSIQTGEIFTHGFRGEPFTIQEMDLIDCLIRCNKSGIWVPITKGINNG